ncbi:MAG: hypothetical protein V1837_02545 [Candidatus Woesearchaeota archaeon]
MFDTEVEKNQVILCVSSEGSFYVSRSEILKALKLTGNNICYVGFSKPYQALKNELTEFPSIFYIDTLTMSVQMPPHVDDCFFVQAPNALTDLSVAISKVMSEKGPSNIFFDSLSSLLLYQDSHTLIKFLHNLINKVRVLNVKIVFVVLQKDAKSDLVKDLCMFVDIVVN